MLRISVSVFGCLLVLGTFSYTEAQGSNVPSESCVRAKLRGDASTYNPNLPGWRTGGQQLATGGRYNADGWEAALQLDAARQYGCGYGSGRTCQVIVESPETQRAAVLIVNDNGPLVAGRVIDLNEKSMQYLSNGRYGRNSGVLKNVTVTILTCSFTNFVGPLNPTDRESWSQVAANTPTTHPGPYSAYNPYTNGGITNSPLGYQSGTGNVGMFSALGAYAGTSAYPSQPAYPSSPLSVSQQLLQNPAIPIQNPITYGSGTSTSALLIQPKNARVGQPVIVSWTSVNMDAQSTCRVIFDKQGADSGPVFGAGSEGTKKWMAASGTHTFDLICVPSNGRVFSITDSITVTQ
jgi:hypothetical protein